MPVWEMLERMPSSELSEWLAYEMENPFGPEIDNWNSANIAATLLNVNRSKRSDPIAKASDLMPSYKPKEDEYSEDRDIAKVQGITAFYEKHNGND